MKVNLFRQEEAVFTLQEEKCDKINYDLFCHLTKYLPINELSEEEIKNNINYPKVVVFKTTEDFHKDAWRYDIDKEKEILINKKGNIFCFLKMSPTTGDYKFPKEGDYNDSNEEENNKEASDVTTDTEEN